METVYNSKNTLTVGAFSFTSLSAQTITASGPPAAAANSLTVIGSSTTGNVVQFSNTAGGTFIMTNAGRVGIGTPTPGYVLDVTGDVNLTGTLRQNGSPFSGSQWIGTSALYFLGNVGIGTTIPAYTLDVAGNINFSGAITQGGAPLSSSQWTGTSAIYFAGNVGIGTTNTTYPLIVRGTGTSTAAPYSNLAYQAGGWYQAYEPTAATTLKIYTDGKIGCTEVDVFSDARIKTDIQDSDSSKDLDTVLALRVREFRYKDPIEHGERTYTGLVAQEVKEVFPAAVSTHEGVIPDVFQVPTSFSGRVCQFTNKIEGLQVGARVKVLDESVEKFLEVVRVSEFEIEFDSEIDGPKVFVYGQAVKDLHTVSYDRLVPVLISAVQELSKKLERS